MDTNTPRRGPLREAASDFVTALDVRRRVHEHPYGALAAAAGLGYVLGGGLFTRLTARLLKVGARVGAALATVPSLVRAVDALAAANRARRQPRR
jgi:hypothetical protein